MNVSGVSDRRPIAVAFFSAAVVSAVLFAAFTFAIDTSGLRSPAYAMLLLLVGMASSLLAIVVLALPALLVLVRLRLVNLWSALTSGLVIGTIVAGLTEWPQSGLEAFRHIGLEDHAVRRTYVFALIGTASALSFWLTWKSRGAPETGTAPTVWAPSVRRRRWLGSLCIQILQGLRGGEDRDALIGVQDEQVLIARDDELGSSGERAGKHMIIVGIATDRRR